MHNGCSPAAINKQKRIFAGEHFSLKIQLGGGTGDETNRICSLSCGFDCSGCFPVAVYAASNEQVVFEYLTNTMGLNTAAACGAMATLRKSQTLIRMLNIKKKTDLSAMVFVSGMACAVQRWRITVLRMDMIPRR